MSEHGSTDEVRRQYRITGRVQGVGFRWWTRQQAERLGLRGTVRNLADGTVEVRVAGPGPAVERFRTRLEEGPRAAIVRSIEGADPPQDALPQRFTIVH